MHWVPHSLQRLPSASMATVCVAAMSMALMGTSAWAESAAELQSKGYAAAYSLDRDEARALFERAVKLAPGSASAHRGLATISWLTIASSRGIVTSDEFLGGAPRQTLELPPPPAEPARLFHEHAARALELAESRVRANPRDAAAHYEVGATIGLQASYMASIEGKLFAAFRSARRAYGAHERVLELDPTRKDAGLIVGTYRYLVSTLSMPGRWVAYIVGFGGGRERGLQMIEAAAAHDGDAQTDAMFALVILYNREKRYADAMRVLENLRRRYPRNRLLWLELGSTALRADRLAEAERFLREGMERLSRDDRPRIFGEEALWRYKLGEVQLGRRQRAAARETLQASLRYAARDWVRARTHLALGRLAGHDGDSETARTQYALAAKFAESGRDGVTLDEARRQLRRR